jgi:predicted PilT family ATPase
LDEQVSDEVEVDPKWHKKFIIRRAKLINQISDENCNVKISFPKQSNSNQVSLKGPKDAVEAAKKRILELVYEFENQVTIEVHVPQRYHVAIIGKNGANSQQISDEFKVEIQFPAKSNSDANGDINNENDSTEQSDSTSPSKSDIILITGLKDNCEKAKESILALVPITENVSFPKKFHKELVANKAELLINLSNTYNIQIKVPKRDDEANYITIEGTKENIEEARKGIEEKVTDLELKNYSVEITNIKSELIPQFRGRNGKEAEKLEKKYQVRIDFSKKGEPDKIAIRGVKKNVEECEAFIRKKIQEDENKISNEITVDNRVHSRLIGYQGKALLKITEKFKVDIKFEGRTSDVVIVKGDSQDAVDDAIDYIKNLEEEYLQDVIDKEAYTHPSRTNNVEPSTNGNSQGFIIRGAPWEQAPDTSNMEDFPTITSAVTGSGAGAQKASWGPSRK